jgi:hypothetical protein
MSLLLPRNFVTLLLAFVGALFLVWGKVFLAFNNAVTVNIYFYWRGRTEVNVLASSFFENVDTLYDDLRRQ